MAGLPLFLGMQYGDVWKRRDVFDMHSLLIAVLAHTIH